tara:strand:- start:40 stop:1299 length:1260 start_codon:yes stop_codon:yes gene_type:complete
MKAPILAIVLIFVAVSAANADFASGLRSYEAGSYHAAYKEWLPLAEGGDPAAQRNLGHLYRLGQGVAKDFVKAAEWYRKSAKQGFARAQANLGNMYLRGQGVPKDPIIAAKWFTRAAQQDNAIAQYNLGLMYENGIGLAQNDVAALGWYYRASRAGHSKATQRLGHLVSQAATSQTEISLPTKKAETQDNIARAQRGRPAQPFYPGSGTKIEEDGHILANNTAAEESATAKTRLKESEVTPHPIIVAEAQKNAQLAHASAAMLRKEAEVTTDINARADVKSNADVGKGTTSALMETKALPQAETVVSLHAVIVAEAAAAAETTPLGALLDAGLAAYQVHDYETALNLWLPCAEDGDLNAQFFIGGLYRDGAGVQIDLASAFHWWTLAAEQGHPQAGRLLVELQAEILPQELDAARKLRE